MAKRAKREVRKSLFDAIEEKPGPADIVHRWEGCKLCPVLAIKRKNLVFWDGDPGRRVLVVGQWPGKEEDRDGVPFQGQLGKMCRGFLAGAGIPAADTSWTNVLACRVPDGDSFRVQYMSNCHDLLESQISMLQPSLIIGMGKIAIDRLCLTNSAKVKEMAGTTGRYKGIPVFFVRHPALLARIQDNRKRAEAEEVIRAEFAEAAALYHRIVGEENQ